MYRIEIPGLWLNLACAVSLWIVGGVAGCVLGGLRMPAAAVDGAYGDGRRSQNFLSCPTMFDCGENLLYMLWLLCG